VRDAPQTRARGLDAAIELLTEAGYAGTTTRAVQEASGLTRGAFLHHFPTREALLASVIDELIDRRATRARQLIDRLDARPSAERLGAAIGAVRELFSDRDFLAEMELWSAARTNPALMAAIRPVEARVGRRLRQQLAQLFGSEIAGRPRSQVVARITVELSRGLAISNPLRGAGNRENALLEAWAQAAATLLADG
jgi:AcrR family transcriptional regulator